MYCLTITNRQKVSFWFPTFVAVTYPKYNRLQVRLFGKIFFLLAPPVLLTCSFESSSKTTDAIFFISKTDIPILTIFRKESEISKFPRIYFFFGKNLIFRNWINGWKKIPRILFCWHFDIVHQICSILSSSHFLRKFEKLFFPGRL